MATIIVGMIVVTILALAGRQLYKDKKNGKSLCGGKCSRCIYGCACNKTNKNSVE